MNKGYLYLVTFVLLIAVFIYPLPYSFYQLLRWGVFVIAGLLAFNNKGINQIVAGILAILFNPIAPIHLERESWQVVDFLAAGSFLWLSKK
jgi:hypothetical protein